jgi:uncharacterized protein with FMN-binding domain
VKRAPIVLSATVSGLAATLGFNARSAHPATTPATATTAALATSSGSAAPASSGSAASSSASKTAARSSAASKTVTSDAVSTQYGDVQLKVTVVDGKITKIEPVQLPSNDPKSVEIAGYAEPLLRQNALAKQSADIDVVSGATYTSEGYKAALQSALDKVGL